MPSYTYVCKECKKSFTLTMSIAEYERKKISCPGCSSKKVEQKPSAFFAVSAKKS